MVYTKKYFKYIIIKIFISNFLLQNMILCEEDECERETPIKVGTECLSRNCSKLQFETGECKISNSIIKTQWLNNIILLGEKDFRYVNFMTSSEGKMILYTSAYPHNVDRIFFGIGSKGEPLFKNSNGNETYIIKKTAKTNYRYESDIGPLKITGDSNENKEYLISFPKSGAYTEIFDFDNYENDIIEIENTNTINISSESYLGCIFSLNEEERNSYVYGGIIRNSTYKFIIIKYYFTYDTSGNFVYNKIISKEFDTLDRKIVNCYLNNKNIIICMIVSNNSKYKMIFLDYNLDNKNDIEFSIESPSSTITFFKFFHLKDNIDILTYYKGKENDYPTLQLIETEITDTTYSANLGKEILLNEYTFNNFVTLTDVIKMRDNLVCLAGSSPNKEDLIISLVNFYNEMEYNIRYYKVNIFQLYNHKFFREMKLHLYNNNLALGFSFCPQTNCNLTREAHYTSLIFFSYPNTTEANFDIIKYLNKNETNDLMFNLFDNVIIDNNIFGFILYGIKISFIDNCGINFISNKTKSTIKVNDLISKNETIYIEFLENDYQILTCKLSYVLIITEPDYEQYNKYPNSLYKNNDELEKEKFSNTYYEGKIQNFFILISQEITKSCEIENCYLCLQSNISQCLIFNYNYDYNYTFMNNTINTIIFHENETNLNCKIDQIIQGNCPDLILNNETFKELYSIIKDEILKKNYNKENIENIVIPTGEAIFQISKLEEQKNANSNISSIDLKDCEQKLKKQYKIKDEDSLIILIIFKTDIKNEDKITTYVHYEIYSPYKLEKLNLSYCEDSDIIINIPVNLDADIISLYNRLSQSGYNLFDANDDFYNDICTPYTTENGTDIILLDRKNKIYYNYGNITLCQSGCELKMYNSTNNKVSCSCSIYARI